MQGAEGILVGDLTSWTLSLLTCAMRIITVTVCPRAAARIQEKHALVVP